MLSVKQDINYQFGMTRPGIERYLFQSTHTHTRTHTHTHTYIYIYNSEVFPVLYIFLKLHPQVSLSLYLSLVHSLSLSLSLSPKIITVSPSHIQSFSSLSIIQSDQRNENLDYFLPLHRLDSSDYSFPLSTNPFPPHLVFFFRFLPVLTPTTTQMPSTTLSSYSFIFINSQLFLPLLHNLSLLPDFLCECFTPCSSVYY